MRVVTVDDAVVAIEQIAGHWPRGEKRPEFLRRVASACGLSPAAVERIFYGKRKRLYADEYLTLKARLTALQERRAKNETAHAEYAERYARDRTIAGRDAQPPGRSGAAPLGSGALPDAAREAAAAGQPVAGSDDDARE